MPCRRSVPWLVALAATSALAVAGCGLLTGVGDLVIDRTNDADGDGGAARPDGASPGDAAPVVVGAVPETAVFYLQARATGSSAREVSPGVVSVGSGLARTIGCASNTEAKLFAPTPRPGQIGPVANGPYRYANLAMRAFQAPDAPRGALVFLDTSAPGPRLMKVDETSDCALRPAVRIDRRDQATEDLEHVMPRFSPTGSRVAYIDSDPDGGKVEQLVTVALDGASPRVVRRSTSGGGNTVTLHLSPPAWVSEQELVWFERNPGQQTALPLKLQRGADVSGSAPSSTVTCNTLIEQMDIFSRDDAVRVALVEATQPWAQAQQGGPSNLVVRDLASACTGPGTRLTNESEKGTAARDVTVSPGGTFAAFAWNVATPAATRNLAAPMHVYVVDTSGQSPPALCSGEDANTDDFGPQWLAGGLRLAWMHTARNSNREAIYVADVVDGRCVNPRPLLAGAPSSGDRYLTAANVGVSCALGLGGIGAGDSPRHAGATVATVLALGALRARRRRRSSARS